ncbi:hypothetical protein NsoK4_02865 [Nitrosopumilus sp. K4]|uniref:hypothetical protein n=1 Tax=Nitrosopumilus sp. K4 TaxID=2795383 RepID=UPI001BA59AF9|nr:hypothetical protein [Nitrosopumilus sp. K4]QUC65211.1 hypothetical protein NsoK4_02865 [Nitrosopumilus sp. K4]
MTQFGAGNAIYSLRKKIQEVKSELNALGDPIVDLPELISSANLLRSNEYLSKSNEKKSELISTYEQYASALEDLLSTVFEIQNELKDVLKEQSSLISTKTSSKTSKKTSKPKTQKRSKK